MSALVDEYIDELRHTVTVAGLNYQIWWSYHCEDTRPKYAKTMNRYHLFFKTSIHAHFVALLIALYRLYETRPDTFNVPNLLKVLAQENAAPVSVLEKLNAHYSDAKPLWIKISTLRNEAFGHRARSRTFEQAFEKAGVTANEISELIEITKRLLNSLTMALRREVHAFNLGSREDLLSMLRRLDAASGG